MRKFTTVLFILLCVNLVNAQWTDLNTSILGNLNSVFFTHVDTGKVVGNTGVYKTDDGGLSWNKELIIGNSNDSLKLENSILKSVYAKDGLWFFVGLDTVSNEGVVFRSSSIIPLELSFILPNISLNDVYIGVNEVVVVGDMGNIYVSPDDGVTWSSTISNTTRDLYCVHFNYAGGDSIILKASNINNYSTGFNNVHTKTMNDVFWSGSTYAYGVNDSEVLQGFNSNWVTSSTKYTGALEATSISFSPTEAYIGTKNGILRSLGNLTTQEVWERFPTTLNTYISNLYFITGTYTGYAVGKNGLVLKTINGGAATLPYISFSGSEGGCVDSTISFINNSPTSYSYIWLINGNAFANTYNSDSAFSSIGSYTVSLVANNGWLSDTVSLNFNIVNLPDTNKNILIVDSLLCKNGNSDVIIQSSEINVEYKLVRIVDKVVVDAVNGNGGNVILNTGNITDSTYYVIIAKSVFSDCEICMKDTILIGVEKTKADFHPNLINADLQASVHYFNNSQQATFFDWTFGPGGLIPTSTLQEPDNFYNILGQTQTTLIATSLYGCRDTTVISNPFIYDENLIIDNCWALNFDGNKLGIYEHDRGEEVKVANNGDIIISGSYSEMEFHTKAGITGGRNLDIGFFIARYTSNGALKWLVKGVDQNPGNNPKQNWSYEGAAFDLAIDEADNIFIAGWLDYDFLLYSNNGKVIPFDNYSEGFILKLDSNGVFQWYTGMDAAVGEMIAVDDSNNIYVGGRYHHTAKFYSVSGSFIQKSISWEGTPYIMKLDSMGEIKWVTDFSSTQLNYYYSLSDLAVDEDGDLYATGQHAKSTTFNSINGPGVNITGAVGGGANAYIVKYNSSGNALWAHSINSFGTVGSSFDIGLAIEVDNVGNSYMTLDEDVYSLNAYMEIPSVQGPIQKLYVGTYALISYDTDGNYRWGNGVQFSSQGRGTAVTIDDFGNVYTTGYLSTTFPAFANFTSTDSNVINLPVQYGTYFIAKYNLYGNLIWATLESGLTSNNIGTSLSINSIAVDKEQSAFVTGYLRRSINAGPYYMATDSLSTNNRDPFIAKYSSSACLQPDSIFLLTSAGPYCVGDTIEYPFQVNSLVTLSPGNLYQLELSDSLGNFTSPTAIGTLNSINNIDTIIAVIPYTVSQSGNYSIRLVSSQPNIIGNVSSINISSIPTSIFASYEYCNGNSLSLQSNSGINYSWHPSVGLSDTIIQKPITTTTNSIIYYVEVNTHCGLVNDTFDIVVNQLPLVSLMPFNIDTVCDNSSIFSLPIGNPGGGIYNGIGVQGLNFNPPLAGFGYHSIEYSYVDSNFCMGADTSYIMVEESYINNQNHSICQGDSMFIYGTYQSAAGIYYDSLQTINGCDSILATTLTVNPLPNVTIANFTPDTLCDNGSLVALPTGTPSGGNYSGVGVGGGNFDPVSAGVGTHSIIYTYTDGNTCMNIDTTIVTVKLCVGVNELPNDFGILIYPNPNTGLFTIEKPVGLNEEVKVKLLDATAKLILDKVIPIGKQKIEVDITNYSKGMYYLQLIVGEEVFVKQILKD